MRRIVLALFASLSVAHSAAQAQSFEQLMDAQLGTIYSKLTPQYAEGKLFSCGIEFTSLIRDWTYRQGSFAKVTGSFGVMSAKNGALAVVLKVVVFDMDNNTLKLTPAPPASAYFVGSDLETTSQYLVSSYGSDTPGALFSVFKTDAFRALADAIATDKVTIAFAKRKGGQDITLTVETDVVDSDKNGNKNRQPGKNAAAFVKCARTLANSASK